MRKFIMAVLAALVVAAFAAGPAAATSTRHQGPAEPELRRPRQFAAPGFTDSAGFPNAQDHYAGTEDLGGERQPSSGLAVRRGLLPVEPATTG